MAMLLAGSSALFVTTSTVWAWSGDAWGNISRATIKANADLMIDSTWVPKNTFTNFQYGSTYKAYTKGQTYTGVPYSQNSPQENWPELSNAVANTTGGSVGYGNDCSGFVSICWRLPTREVTATFESKLGGTAKWFSLGDIGSAATTPLIMGDALNSSSVGHIVLFLNFESSGVRTMEQTPNNAQRKVRSYSNVAEYRPIRRLQVTDSPIISADLVSRVADAGQPVRLKVTATGTEPLVYRWYFNGSLLASAKTNELLYPSVDATNMGSFACVVSNASGMATSRVASLSVYPLQATVFLDDFDTNSASQWRANSSSADTRGTFNYDYLAMGIPPAPHSTGATTRGLRLEANLNAGATAALSLSPLGQQFTGDYRLRFDMWINANGPFPGGGVGSTEHVTAGIGTTGNAVQWTGSGSTADGCWFSVDGEGGASDASTTSGDFCAFAGASLLPTASGCYVAGTDSGVRGNLHPYYASAFPTGATAPTQQQASYAQQTGALASGTVGFAWREVIISRRGNVVDWSIDGIRIATVTNATLQGNNIFVGYWDSYASISDNANLSFGLIDNVRVEIPAQAPEITVNPQGQSVKWSSNAVFSATIQGTPPLVCQWQCNSTNIPGATNATYTRYCVAKNDEGTYRLVVTNLAGKANSQTAALVVELPQPPRFATVQPLADKRLRLEWTGEPGWSYALQASTNADFSNWSIVGPISGVDGHFEFIDSDATNSPQRFYRLKQ